MDSGSVSMELESEPSVWEERYDDVEREGRSRGAVGISLTGVSCYDHDLSNKHSSSSIEKTRMTGRRNIKRRTISPFHSTPPQYSDSSPHS